MSENNEHRQECSLPLPLSLKNSQKLNHYVSRSNCSTFLGDIQVYFCLFFLQLGSLSESSWFLPMRKHANMCQSHVVVMFDSLLLQIFLCRALHSIKLALALSCSLLGTAVFKLLFCASEMPQFSVGASCAIDCAKAIYYHCLSLQMSLSLLCHLHLCYCYRFTLMWWEVLSHAPCITQSVSHDSACVCLCNHSNHSWSKNNNVVLASVINLTRSCWMLGTLVQCCTG